MASIKINEIDSTVVNPIVDDSDNIVYVPGNAITGPSGVPTLCKTYDDFIGLFGESAPASDTDDIGTAWHYAANLLQAGLYVLFERVIPDSATATKATAMITNNDSEIGLVTELYGGTFGNSLAYSIVVTNTEIRFKTLKRSGTGYTQLEDFKLVSTTGKTADEIKAELVALIGSGYKTEYVEITITDKDNFVLAEKSNVELSGGTDVAESAVAAAIPSVYSKLSDTILYDFKFVTSANYYNYTDGSTAIDVITPMINLAESRKDCTVFANIPISLDKAEVQNFVKSTIASSYCTIHAPWSYTSLSIGGTKWMAPSYIALAVLAKSLKMGYKIWQAPAGVNRGTAGMVTNTEYEVGSVTLDEWQNTKAPYVNPIMYLLKYGYVIFGQRTTYMVSGSEYDKSSLQELSVRLTANEIKRKIRTICLGLSFEANNLRTWNAFRGQLVPYLADMKAYGGLEDFKVVMDDTTTTSVDINNNRIVGTVSVVISRAAEDFVINFTLEPSGTTFDEEE